MRVTSERGLQRGDIDGVARGGCGFDDVWCLILRHQRSDVVEVRCLDGLDWAG